jgi:hypothetical protein
MLTVGLSKDWIKNFLDGLAFPAAFVSAGNSGYWTDWIWIWLVFSLDIGLLSINQLLIQK